MKQAMKIGLHYPPNTTSWFIFKTFARIKSGCINAGMINLNLAMSAFISAV